MGSTSPVPRSGILDIAPYVPGESHLAPGVTPIKLSSNETPLGPSEKAIAAFRSAAGGLVLYPVVSCSSLLSAISPRYGLYP